MKVAIASDHAGLELKAEIHRLLKERQIEPLDLGTDNADSVDYPDYGTLVAQAVSSGRVQRGILICGTGIGMSIVANKFSGARAALCHDIQTARTSRQHNDANILVLGGRVLEDKTALEMVGVWLETPFEGGRHARRVPKISEIEKKTMKRT
jgi:ribose 5-phosphate isomerase B